MNKEKHIYLAAIRRELQTQYQYESREKRNWAFKTLFLGWRAQGLRKKLHSGSFYTLGWTRGWLSQKAADSLREYIGLR